MGKLRKIEQRNKRRKRIRGKVSGTSLRPRLSVFRSNNHIFAQVIDDQKGVTLVSATDKELSLDAKSGDKSEKSNLKKKEMAFAVGELLAEKSAKKKIKKVAFDRGGYRFHGRVASLAEGAKKGGLEF